MSELVMQLLAVGLQYNCTCNCHFTICLLWVAIICSVLLNMHVLACMKAELTTAENTCKTKCVEVKKKEEI